MKKSLFLLTSILMLSGISVNAGAAENITLQIDTAEISYTSILDANAYGAYSSSWKMSGTASYVKQNGQWIWTTNTTPQGN